LLSGDSSDQVAVLANALGFDEYQAGCTAADKLARISSLQAMGGTVLMVGDGVNDAPVIAAADVSVAMAGASDLTRSCADVALLSDRLSLIELLFTKSAKMGRILRQNIFWALLYNGTALPAAAAGLVPPWLAAIGMSLSSLVVVLNALRLDRQEQQRSLNAQHVELASV
jgi:Cu2+-exporting ATPase